MKKYFSEEDGLILLKKYNETLFWKFLTIQHFYNTYLFALFTCIHNTYLFALFTCIDRFKLNHL